MTCHVDFQSFPLESKAQLNGFSALSESDVLAGYTDRNCGPKARKAPETFRFRKAIFSSFVSKNGEVYAPETSCVNRTSVHIKNT